MARSILFAPGTPVGSLMLPERSMTSTVSTGGGSMARATSPSITDGVTASSGVVTVRLPLKSTVAPDAGDENAAYSRRDVKGCAAVGAASVKLIDVPGA